MFYQVYEKDTHGREYGQAVFRHRGNANDFCRTMNERWGQYSTGSTYYVRSLRGDSALNLQDYLG